MKGAISQSRKKDCLNNHSLISKLYQAPIPYEPGISQLHLLLSLRLALTFPQYELSYFFLTTMPTSPLQPYTIIKKQHLYIY